MKTNNASKVIALASVVSALGFCPSAFAGDTAPSKEVVQIEEKSAEPFGLNVTLAYDSQYIFRGVNILGGGEGFGFTDGGSLVSADINYTKHGFTIGGWYASSVNETPNRFGGAGSNGYTELDLYLSYARTFGPVTVSTGYIYYLFPDAAGADTNLETHEFNVGVSTNVIPFVTPSLTFYYDIDLFQGGYLEFKLASSIPVIADKLSIDPYALVSYDFDYNSITKSDAWNHFQAGVNVPYKIHPNVTISAYSAIAVALDALQGDTGAFANANDYEIFGGAKITFSF